MVIQKATGCFALFAFAIVAHGISTQEERNATQVSPEKPSQEFNADQITESSLSTQMAFIFGPSFEKLKAEIGSEADGEVDWGVVKQHSLIISESLSRLHRWPEIMEFESEEKRSKYEDYWEKNNVPAPKKSAHELYQLAKQKLLDPSKAKLVELANNCNICHGRAGGWSPVVIKP